MDELEFNGKVKGLKTLKELIASKEVIPASQLETLKAEEAAQEKAFEEAVRSEESHRKTKMCTGKVDGRVLWTRERFVE
jgi:hypothetical protein